jgi:hypothetical protein
VALTDYQRCGGFMLVLCRRCGGVVVVLWWCCVGVMPVLWDFLFSFFDDGELKLFAGKERLPFTLGSFILGLFKMAKARVFLRSEPVQDRCFQGASEKVFREEMFEGEVSLTMMKALDMCFALKRALNEGFINAFYFVVPVL